MKHTICDECETVAHCSNNGCIPKQSENVAGVNTLQKRVAETAKNVHEQPAQQQEPVADSKAPMLADWLQANYEADEIDEAAEELRRLFRENQLLWKEREKPHQKLEFYIRECNRLESERDVALTKQQKPVAWINWCAATGKRSVSFECESELASQPLYEGITQNTQYHYSKFHSWFDSELHRQKYTKDHPAYLAAQEAWNAANDAAQHRINRLNAEIEAWKVRFKIAEDALAKLNGPEQKPVATMWQHGETGRTRITMPGDITDCDARWFKAADLYTSPPASKPWVGLNARDLAEIPSSCFEGAIWADAKLREKNT